MAKWLYHQIENTNDSELSTYIYDYNAWDFNSPHFHKNIEILVVVTGVCHCVVGEQEYTLREGDAVYVMPFQVHSLYVEEGASVRCVTFSDLLVLTLSKEMEGKKAQTALFRPAPETRGFFLDQMLLLFGHRFGQKRQVEPLKRMKLKGLLYMMGSEFLEQVEFVPAGGSDAIAMDIVQYLSEQYKNDISLHDIAEAKGYNYQYLSRVFNKMFGVNFKKMLNQYRMAHAFALLVDSNQSVAEIAFESGFGSIRSFDHVCREIYGKTPSQLRQKQ